MLNKQYIGRFFLYYGLFIILKKEWLLFGHIVNDKL